MSLSYTLHKTNNDFVFSQESEEKIQKLLLKYPPERIQSAVIPLLDLAQRDHGGWLSKQAISAVADRLDMPDLKVWEIASFYSMFNLDPVGKHLIQVCRTTPCWLRGSDDILKACTDKLGVQVGETSQDGLFTVVEVECLGACVNAPMVQINDDYYEDLTYDTMSKVLSQLSQDACAMAGSQIDRLNSAPESGLTTLLNNDSEHQSGSKQKDHEDEVPC